MCTANHEQSVTVCDVAIDRVRADLARAFGDRMRFTTQDRRGTLVEPDAAVDPERFASVVRTALAHSQPSS